MKTAKQRLVTDQDISQMISSYLIRNPELLYTLTQQAEATPIPVAEPVVAIAADYTER